MPPNQKNGIRAFELAHAQELVAVSTQRTIQVWESAYNAQKVNNKNWNFQIAKYVDNGDGNPKPNVVWQSRSIAPITTIVWQDIYALNWTVVGPDAPGVSVAISGAWQQCQLGESYDLNKDGFWTKSSVTPTPRFMNVGKVDYPTSKGIHIVVGVLNSSGEFDIIYVDPTPLSPGSTAKYQPKEVVEWWYQTGNLTSIVTSSPSNTVGWVDLSKSAPTTDQFYYSTTFNYDSGTWITSQSQPPQSLYAPAPFVPLTGPPLGLFSIWPAFLKVAFQTALDKVQQANASAKLGALLRVTYNNVQVTVIDGLTMDVSIGTPKSARLNSNNAVGAVTDDLIAEVSDLLQFEVDDSDLPSGETWNIQEIVP